jgi:hypothetical protein
MKMNFSKYQNRRDFLDSSVKKGIAAALGFIGISLNSKNYSPVNNDNCHANISCRDCYKMGYCEEAIAVETRKKVKLYYYTSKSPKGANHG